MTRRPFRIVLALGLWGRNFEVSIDPPTGRHPMRVFRTYREARAYAEALAKFERWPLVDRTDEDDGPRAA